MTCACAIAAYLGLALPLLDGIPRTIEFKSVDWSSNSPAETYSFSGVIATSSDGSRMNRVRSTGRRFLFFLAEQRIGHSIYSRTPHVSYLLDDDERIVRVIPCTCEWERNAWPEDHQCASSAKEYDPGLIYRGWTRVAGIPVTKYTQLSPSQIMEVSFAPSAHCEVMEELKIVFGIGQQKSYSRFVITKYIPGEPARVLFTLPSAYRFEQHPHVR
jgi:hypothetical protein